MSSTPSITRARNMAKNAVIALEEAEATMSDLNKYRLVIEAIGELNKSKHLLDDLKEGLFPAAQAEWERTSTSAREQ